MPVYHIKDPQTSQELDIRGDSEPTEEELTQIFAAMRPARGTNAALTLQVARGAVPALRRAAEEAATNPNLPKIGSAAGQIVGGIQGAMRSPLDAAGGAWAGGRAGYFTGKLAQRLAAPVANAMEAVTPYAQTLGTLSGAQGVNDLAQMAEPNRQDIGFLGVGSSAPTDQNHPALINALLAALARRFGLGQP